MGRTFGLGYATPSHQGWIDQGSPTEGLLGKVVVRPMGCRADHPVALRLAARAGTVMMTLMWMVPAAASACGPLGLGRLWARRPVVRDRKWLR
ncbi:hypothetical protein ACFVOB_17370 [Streptomyces rochei]|uniref:hypothetical protein n=1 Tax=Streptomyces rochei TaxID=1928 RepID=UPI0036C8E348